MVNKQKQKGSAFEHDAVEELEELIEGSRWKRVAGSGALGTSLSEPLLMGDITGTVPGFSRKFRVECKVGYNNSTGKEVLQFTLKKEWLDKIRLEAQASYSFPFLLGKFSNARSGTKHFVVMDVRDFAELMNYISELNTDLEKLMK
jgi:hypothetical protein